MIIQSPKRKTEYRENLLKAGEDGAWRSVEELREQAGIPDTTNLSRYLKNLKCDLVIERSEYRLRIMRLKGSAGKFLWRLARVDGIKNYKCSNESGD